MTMETGVMKNILIKIRNAIVFALFKLYVFVRPFTSSVLWRLAYKRHYKNAKQMYLRDRPFEMAIFDFESFLEKIPYQWDSFKGLIDATIPQKYMVWFFREVKKGRDCDDFVRAWATWGIENGYTAKEWITIDPAHPFSSAHVIGTLEKEGDYRLCSLSYVSQQLNSREEAFRQYRSWCHTDNFIAEYKYEREW